MKKALHAVFTLALFTVLSMNSYAQIAEGSLVPNFQWTDTDGVTHDLYEYLDQDKIVVLDLFAVWCGPCLNYVNAGHLETLHEEHGPDGDDTMRIFSIETDPTTSPDDLDGGGDSIADWESLIPFSLANDDNVGDILELAYYPTIYTIYPNRTITESSQVTATQHYNIAQEAQIASDDNDASMVLYSGVNEQCGGMVEVKAFIQNMGLTNLTSATIDVTGDYSNSVSWTGDLGTYSFEEVSLGMFELTENSDVNITVTADGDTYDANDALSESISKMTNVPGTNHIKVQIQCDNWPTETTWRLWSSSGEVLGEGGPYFTANQYIEEDFFVSADECVMFEIEDSYGDGMYASQYGNFEDGGFTVSSRDGSDVVSIIAQSSGADGDEFELESGSAEVVQTVNLNEEELVSEFTVYPNPTNSVANIFYSLNKASDVSVVVFNTLGAVVYNKDLGTVSTGLNNMEISFEGMDAGLYFINLTAEDRVVTKKLTVTK